ncbi:MAG: hypothetical protein ABFC24_11775 [Methanoregulaceae archaeon]
MARGKKPTTTLERAEQAARSFGYRWLANPDPDLPYDAILFSTKVAIAVKVRTVRTNPDNDYLIDELFQKELAGLRSLPLPPNFLRQFWLRTQNMQGWRIFVVVEEGIGEIGFNASTGYYNPLYRPALKRRLHQEKRPDPDASK